MSLITRFFGGAPGLVLSLLSVIAAFIRPGVPLCSLALILSVLVARLVHRQTLQPGSPAGAFRPMFAAAGYTAVAGALYLSLFPLPFGGCFKPFSPIVLPFIFLSILGVHWVHRRHHDAALAGFPTKGDRWLTDEAHVAEVERGFICLGVTGTMWTLVLSGWVAKITQISQPDSQDVLTSLSHLAAMYALYLLPWFCFAWWVAEPAVKRGIYAGAGISLVTVPLAYHGYHHSLSSDAWWQILLSPGVHLAALTFFVATAFLFWWVRPTPATRGSGILSGFYLVAIPAILLLPGIAMTFLWHPRLRTALFQAPDTATVLNLLYPLIQSIILFGPVLLLVVFLAAIFGGARATPSPAEPAVPTPGSLIVAAAGSQTFTVLLGLLLPIPIIATFLTQHVALGPILGGGNYMYEYIVSSAIYFPLLFADAFIFAGLWSAGPFIAHASRLPHPRMAGAALIALQAILIWGFDPRQHFVALFAALLAILLVLKKLFGETIDEARRSLLDFQRFVIWSCFLGMPILFLSSFFVVGTFVQSEQIFNIARLLLSAAKHSPAPDLVPYLHPGAFWAAYPALTAAIGLVLLLGLPLLCLPLYLYPLFKDQKAAESAQPNPAPVPDQPPSGA